MFEAARYVKEQIYGRRLVLFSPLYSSLCARVPLLRLPQDEQEVKRRALTQEDRPRGADPRDQGTNDPLVVSESYPVEDLTTC